MQITTLLSKLTDFVNLGKFLVDAGPGILLAFALTLFATSWAHLPIVPAEVREDTGFVSRYGRFLDGVEHQIEVEEAKLREAVSEKAAADTALERQQKELDAFDASFRELAKVRRDRLTSGVLDGARLGQAESAADTRRQAIEAEVFRLAGEQAVAGRRMITQQSRLDALQARLTGLQGQRVTRLEDLFTLLINHLVGLTLVGWILGVVLSPINRMLFLPRAGKTDAPGPSVRMLKDMPSLDSRVDSLLESYNTSYFIGRGVIAKTDWDEMVSGYYRWAELSANLVLPALTLGVAIAFTMVNSQVTGPSPAAPILVLLGAIGAGGTAWYTGRQNYRTYEQKMQDFTRGRLTAYLEKIAAEASGQATTLAKVVDAAEALLKKLEKKGS